MNYVNQMVLISTLVIGFVGCGDAKESEDRGSSEVKTLNSSSSKPFIKKYAVKSAKIEYEIKNSEYENLLN